MKKYRLNPDAIVDSGKFQYLDRMMPVLQKEVRFIAVVRIYPFVEGLRSVPVILWYLF